MLSPVESAELRKRYEIRSLLSGGRFGTVRLVRNVEDLHDYVAKSIVLDILNEKERESVLNEVHAHEQALGTTAEGTEASQHRHLQG